LAHQFSGYRRRAGRAAGLVFASSPYRYVPVAVWEHLADDVYTHTGATACSMAKVALSGRRVVKDLGAKVTKHTIQTAICICTGTSSPLDKIIFAAEHGYTDSSTTATYPAKALKGAPVWLHIHGYGCEGHVDDSLTEGVALICTK
jgi:hypothetical protein